jgi:uncharacterized membrane protein YtjA (UPF0391 family)
MLRWALIFAVVAIIAGLLGFTGIAGTSIAIAKTLFFVFLVIVVVLLLAGLFCEPQSEWRLVPNRSRSAKVPHAASVRIRT